jgi:heme exporter protein B
VQRSFALEEADGNRDALRLSGLSPAGVVLGKVLGVAGQLLVLQAVLLVGVAVLYGTRIEGVALLVATCLAATAGLASAGCLFAALAAGLRVRDTLLPLLLLPVLAPVLLAATRAFDDALGVVGVDGWAWVNLLVVFAVVYVSLALLLAPVLLEEG